jgi:hypothetical protein
MKDLATATAKLADAAQLIDDALVGLDVSGRPCASCGKMDFDNYTEAKIFESLAGVPERLRLAARRLAGHDDAAHE